MLSFTVFDGGRASIKNENGQWWCGQRHEWVHPESSHWHFDPGCWNEIFPSLKAAMTYARRRGWLRR